MRALGSTNPVRFGHFPFKKRLSLLRCSTYEIVELDDVRGFLTKETSLEPKKCEEIRCFRHGPAETASSSLFRGGKDYVGGSADLRMMGKESFGLAVVLFVLDIVG